MRVLYFTRRYTPHDHRFLTALAQTDIQVFSLCLESGETQVDVGPLPTNINQVVWRGGKKQMNWKEFPLLLLDLKRVLREVKPHLVHAGPLQQSAFLTALAGFHPLISMSWGSDLLYVADLNRWWRWITSFTLRRSDILLGDCSAVEQKALDFGFSAKNIVLFPWGVDLNHFQPGDGSGLRQRLGWENAFVLLSLRSWEPIYGVADFLLGFVSAARHIPELRLLLLGAGSQAECLRSILAQADMLDRVYFAGFARQSDLPNYYRAADLYVSASYSDGSSVSLMEALACGCPVLVSDIAGNREWVTSGSEGWLFPPGNPDAICSGIIRAVESNKQRQAMSQAARRRAEERADWSKNFQKLLAAYKMALERCN